MKTIIRIEHPKDGYGIWWSRNENDELLIKSLSSYYELAYQHGQFPLARKEITGFISGTHFCAFKTVEQMTEWVKPSEIKELISMGFKVLAIDVSEWLEGEYQICFERAHVIQTKDISSLFQ